MNFAGDSNELLKNLFTQTIADEISETMSRNKAKLYTTRKLRYLLLRNFWPKIPKFHFWKEGWELGSASIYFETFLIFSNVLLSYVSSGLATCDVTPIK